MLRFVEAKRLRQLWINTRLPRITKWRVPPSASESALRITASLLALRRTVNACAVRRVAWSPSFCTSPRTATDRKRLRILKQSCKDAKRVCFRSPAETAAPCIPPSPRLPSQATHTIFHSYHLSSTVPAYIRLTDAPPDFACPPAKQACNRKDLGTSGQSRAEQNIARHQTAARPFRTHSHTYTYFTADTSSAWPQIRAVHCVCPRCIFPYLRSRLPKSYRPPHTLPLPPHSHPSPTPRVPHPHHLNACINTETQHSHRHDPNLTFIPTSRSSAPHTSPRRLSHPHNPIRDKHPAPRQGNLGNNLATSSPTPLPRAHKHPQLEAPPGSGPDFLAHPVCKLAHAASHARFAAFGACISRVCEGRRQMSHVGVRVVGGRLSPA